MAVQIGDRCRDKVSGFVGIVTCRIEFLNGCIRVDLQPTVDKDGKPVDARMFDIDQVEVVDVQAVPFKYAVKPTAAKAVEAQPAQRTGGNQMPSSTRGY